MPIPALKVKSPQSWKNKRSYPSDKLIEKRKAAFSFGRNRGDVKLKVPKRSGYFGRSDGSSVLKQKILKPLLKLAIFVFIFIIVITSLLFFYYSSQVPTREEFLASTEGSTTKIYDRTGKVVLYDLSGDTNKTWVPLDQIPEYVKWAVISVEDDQFYAHRGFDFPALVKVGLHELFGIGPRRGGSTITQQLVKNALLSPEKTYRRKIKEMVIAYQVEKKFSKDEILELYFNVVPYGSTAYGIEAAAQAYFGKSASQLDLAEGAILAAMLKATTYYSPHGSHLDELFDRQHFVLNQMVKLGYVNEQAAEAAMERQLEFKKLPQSIKAPHYVLYLKELLAEKYGEEMVEKGGLKVISSLDWDKQQIAEEALKKGVEKNEANYGAHNAALVSIDARTGEVLAMVGSRDYFNQEYDGAVNVTMRPRQPGSSFKPVVYAASFLKGLSPETILFDVVTKFKTDIEGEYEPHNYDDKEHGPLPIRKTLAGSLNIPAVKTIYLTGVENVLNLAEKMGYTTLGDRSRFGLSLVLGGGEVKLVDHVKAFAVFAQNGQRHDLQYILQVLDKNGKVLEEFKATDNAGEEVLEPQVAKEINSILSDDSARAYIFGVGSQLTLPDRPVAAKTGTTNDYKDAWTIGYTSSLVTGVWVGNNNNAEMKRGADGSIVAAPIWHEYMKRALAGTPAENFEAPVPAELPEKPMLNGQIGQANLAQIDRASGKLATPLTPPSFIEEKNFQEVHCILHYVNVNNILGPIPEHPESDAQYENWEAAVKRWATENKLGISAAQPTAYDDLHTEENKPNLEIRAPSDGAQFNSLNLNVEVAVTTKRAISRLEYYLDNQLLAKVTRWPFNLVNYELSGFGNGEKWLRVIAYDDIDNSREKSIRIYLNLPSEYTEPVVWLTPAENDKIYAEQLPYNLRLRINNYSLYNKVDFYMKKGDGSSIWLGYSEVKSAEAGVLLTEALPGEYDFYAVLTGKDGRVVKDKGIRVQIEEQ